MKATEPRLASGEGARSAVPAPAPPRPRRAAPRFRPYLIEVAGGMDDPAVRAVTDKLRALRNRYFPILRFIFTLVANRVSENDLLPLLDSGGGPSAAAAAASAAPSVWIARPPWAVTGNKSRPIVRRLHAAEAQPSPSSLFEAFMTDQFLPQAMTHNILSRASPVAAAPFSEADVATLVVRHYVHESSRTAAFLVGDREAGTAALIDPQQHVEPYVRDLTRLGLRLTHIVVTHCLVDAALGVRELLEIFCDARVCSGVAPPAWVRCAPSDVADCTAAGPPVALCCLHAPGTVQEVALSERVTLRAITVPSFSPESQLVELRLRDELLAVFTGTAWGTDAAPRADLFDSFPLHYHAGAAAADTVAGGSLAEDAAEEAVGAAAAASIAYPTRGFASGAALATAQRNLKRFLYDAYLFPESAAAPSLPTSPSVSAEGRFDHVVLLPSHGGYSNASNQLDLYWAAHMGDLKRMRHARVVVDTLASEDAYASYARRLPRLPYPQLFAFNRLCNAQCLLRAHLPPGRARAAPLFSSLTPSSAGAASSPPSVFASPFPVCIIDVRDTPDYRQLHLRTAANVPMSFPGEAYGAKRAELWLQCLLLPTQPVLAIVKNPADAADVRQRLRTLSSGAAVCVRTVEQLLLPLQNVPRSTAPAWRVVARDAEEVYCTPALRAVAGDVAERADAPFSEERVWVAEEANGASAVEVHLADGSLAALAGTAPRKLARVDSPEGLSLLEPGSSSSGTLVVDVRTPYEFKNGSHQRSVHLPLCDLCAMSARATLDETAFAALTSDRAKPCATDDACARRRRDLFAAIKEKAAAADGSTAADAFTRAFLPLQDEATRRAPAPLADVLLGSLRESAIVSGVVPASSPLECIRTVVMYCAGGYRSLIAASLLRRAVELTVTAEPSPPPPPSAPADEAARPPSSCASALRRMRILDVAGGAFTIMTHRPDLWMVKDRSIICIS